MLLNCGVGEDSWECKEIQPVHPKGNQSRNLHWKDWCWSWNSNTLATWWNELTHLKRPWCQERLKAGGEENDREWHGWMFEQLWEIVKDRETWCATVHEVAKSRTRLGNWTDLASIHVSFENRTPILLWNIILVHLHCTWLDVHTSPLSPGATKHSITLW